MTRRYQFSADDVVYYLAETKNRSRAPYTFRKVRTIRDCLQYVPISIGDC